MLASRGIEVSLRSYLNIAVLVKSEHVVRCGETDKVIRDSERAQSRWEGGVRQLLNHFERGGERVVLEDEHRRVGLRLSHNDDGVGTVHQAGHSNHAHSRHFGNLFQLKREAKLSKGGVKSLSQETKIEGNQKGDAREGSSYSNPHLDGPLGGSESVDMQRYSRTLFHRVKRISNHYVRY